VIAGFQGGNRGNLKVWACLNGSLTMLPVLFFFDYWSTLDRVVKSVANVLEARAPYLLHVDVVSHRKLLVFIARQFRISTIC